MAASTLAPHSCVETKDHYQVIIMGAGLSGMAAAIQLQRTNGMDPSDIIVYEKTNEIGGTRSANTYPGAGCDIPISFYSYSFAKSAKFSNQWALQAEIMAYLRSVRKRFAVNNIRFGTRVEEARWSNEKGLWTLQITDLETGAKATKTCTVLISAVGGLSVPNVPTFANQDQFKGSVFHSAQWRHDIPIKDKNVVIVGNGCSAAQIIPTIAPEVASVTQLARSRQSVLRRLAIPESWLFTWMMRNVPGVLFLFRVILFFQLEGFFNVSDIVKGVGLRKDALDDAKVYMEATAPKKYWDVLLPDFDIAAKRRIFDSGYLASLGRDNVELFQDGIQEFTEDGIVTTAGKEIKADVVVLSTGFKAQEFLFPLNIYNAEGESLRDRFKATNVSNYLATCYSGYPNFFTLMGPNSATGHSSVIYTSECQIEMILKLIKPLIKITSVATPSTTSPSPSIAVSAEAEQAYMARLRKEMKKKVWEKDGGKSWYVDKASGYCTTLYPWSQVHFWWNSAFPIAANFVKTGF